jgi:hypothetical protein
MVCSYGILKSEQGAEHFLNTLDIQVNDQVLRHKMRDPWWGLYTDSIGHYLSFPTPTHTHVFGNHSNDYGHLNTTHVRSLVNHRKTES